MNDLTELVAMAQRYPDLLASTIHQYQIQHHLDDHAMLEYLGLANMHRLHLLCLCERPSNEIYALFINQIERIASYVGCQFRSLARVVIGSPVHFAWCKDQHQELWTCTATCQTFAFQARVARIDNGSYTGYIDGPQGRTWLNEQWQSSERALYQCERLLDALMIAQSSEDTSNRLFT
ncbi:MAG: hypothetical protein MI924_30965 [Chloroflexales bacterium]|nr:hypothetical protein [Chloroflexales bacterium]